MQAIISRSLPGVIYQKSCLCTVEHLHVYACACALKGTCACAQDNGTGSGQIPSASFICALHHFAILRFNSHATGKNFLQ